VKHDFTISIAIAVVPNATIWIGSVFYVLIRVINPKSKSSHVLVFTKSLIRRDYGEEKSK
jgi:hypothetical protein